ncbi:MAG TPA: MmgE/PrpD family protein [Beijerinckiaceae bacterium]|nr:MmgE/PrpD family protein [Beijerinckiaceae bacterium]
MTSVPDPTRRALINAGGAAFLLNTIPVAASYAQSATAPAPSAPTPPASAPKGPISPIANTFADYVANTLDRDLPATAAADAKKHILDTLAAMVSGSRLKPGGLAARYVDDFGGKPQAMVVGTKIVTTAVNAAFANAMAAHSDETDDTNGRGTGHPGCGAIPAALATAELAGRSGNDFLRAVTLAYDVGLNMLAALGVGENYAHYSPVCLNTTFIATAAASALMRLDQRQVRHAFSYAAQQASGLGYWNRDREHIEKAFDYGGMGARNGVMAATMVGFGFTGVEDCFSGNPSVFTSLGDKVAPEKLVAGLGTNFAVSNTTIKKWSVGAPLQSVLDSVAALLDDPGVRADNIKSIRIEMPTDSLRIVDNSTIPDLCAQHLVSLMIVDRGVTFASVHEVARMSDPKVLAVRKLVDLVGSQELQVARPQAQAIVSVETLDGRSLSRHTVVVRGRLGNPMNAQEVEAKALDLMTPVLGAGRANELVAAIRDLENFGPVSGLRRLLQA